MTYLGYVMTAVFLSVPSVVGATQWPTVSLTAWTCLAYIGVMSTVLAYTLFNLGVDRVGSARASQVAYAVPALTTLLATAVSAFRPGWRTWLGLGVLSVGLTIASRSGSSGKERA